MSRGKQLTIGQSSFETRNAADSAVFVNGVMTTPITHSFSPVSAFKRALELWPYVLIAVSVGGLVYIALSAAN
jgi:hypothetical protein